ncbi:CNP1-like family protein [Xylophilus rhododendri]|nr:CNP1-like family protein [Xylophilus rhododendri]
MPQRFSRLAAACGLSALMLAGAAHAGLLFDDKENAKPELAAPVPPPFNPDKTIAVDARVGRSLDVGIDPDTLTSDSDGVVRYVMVARTSSGAITATYEGVRCSTAEVKQYARHYRDGDWQPVAEPRWQSLFSGGSVNYSLMAAKAGVCQDASSGGSKQRILQNLQNDVMRNMP